MTIKLTQQRIIISKTSQIGDVLFALPLASELKRLAPQCHIIFLARNYTKALIDQYPAVDEFADWESMYQNGEQQAIAQLRALNADIIIHVNPRAEIAKIAKKAGIKTRIGVANRLFNWWYCNHLVNIRRSHSDLHETQLDMQFLTLFTGKKLYSLQEIIQLRRFNPFNTNNPWLKLLSPQKFNLILHPKTRGQHTEWPSTHFAELIQRLPTTYFNIFVTGTNAEGDEIRSAMLDPFPQVHDLCGKLSLDELIHFIAHADGLICASTGPVHLAAAFGLHTLGLYAPIKPFHAGRWGPVGVNAQVLCVDKTCNACRYTPKCQCITEITPQQVYGVVTTWQKQLQNSESESAAVSIF